jgi:hypothetical protein
MSLPLKRRRMLEEKVIESNDQSDEVNSSTDQPRRLTVDTENLEDYEYEVGKWYFSHPN